MGVDRPNRPTCRSNQTTSAGRESLTSKDISASGLPLLSPVCAVLSLGGRFRRMLKTTAVRRTVAWRDSYVRSMQAMDGLMVSVTVCAAQLLRFGLDSKTLPLDGFGMPYWLIGVALGLTWWAWLGLRGTRDIRLVGQGIEESKEIVNASLILFGAVAIFSYAFDIPTARGYVIIALPLGISLLLLGRGWIRKRLLEQRRTGMAMARTMIVGGRPGALETVRSLLENPGAGFAPVALYAPPSTRPCPVALDSSQVPPNLLLENHEADVDGIVDACRAWDIEVLVLCASAPLSPDEIRRLGWYLADEQIRLVLDTGLTDIAGPRIHTQHMAGLPLIHVSTPRMSWSRRMCKRSMDVVGAVTALAFLAPVMLALALIVKGHDGGPVLFSHERVGLDGKLFKVLKFRTMRVDAQAMHDQLMTESGKGALLFKLKNDPRVTRPGHWMRKYSFDELPQFVNVLRGEMSLVGPRPQVAAEVAEYEDHVHRRLRVKPGITGLWQVSGRNNLSSTQSTRLDVYYVENWSPAQDFAILLRTVRVVLSREGAY